MSIAFRRLRRVLSVSATAAVAAGSLTACGGSADRAAQNSTPSATTGSAAHYPVTVDNCGYKETFTKAPSRVVILNGVSVGEVESFIELGLQKAVIANTQSYGVSDIPGMQQKVATLPKGGLTMNQNYGVPAEQLIAAKPDLVVSPYAGGFDGTSGFATREELARLGVRTLVTPANCANGNTKARVADKKSYDTAGVAAGFDFLTLLGKVFNVPAKAASVVAGEKAALTRVAKAVAADKDVRGLVAGPGATPDTPYVWTGGIFDDVLRRAGVANAFAGLPREATISAEQLAKAEVDILVLFVDSSVDAPAAAARIFAEHPHWAAAKEKRYVVVHDGMYFGPAAVDGVEMVARAAHPDAF